jgi:outer membrane protein OmpA-like peptidoglycan-associated protein
MKSANAALGVRPMLILTAAMLSGCAAKPAAQTAAAPTVSAPPPVAAPAKPANDAEAKAVADNKVDIEFPAGSAALTPEAIKQLDLAARLYRDAHPIVMFTSGHSDKTGNEYQNVLLSARRAQTVKLALVARGIPPDLLIIQALGVSDPANAADPRAAENRRVTITWRLGSTT